MLKRLIDEDHLDSGDRQLSELLSSASPFEVDPFAKRRIWVRLERASKPPTRVRRFWLRPIVIAALLVSGTAMAELGQRYVLHGSGFLGLAGAPSATSSNVPVAPPSRSAHKPRSTAPLGAAVELAPSASASAVELAPPEADAPRSTPKTTRARPESSEDATHVVQAIQALRTERDPARAQALLNDYLKANPRCALR